MGTPDFAVPTLQTLVNNGQEVVAVVTAPDKPAGRGKKMQASAVKEYALSRNIPILQPEKLKDDNFIDVLRSFQADLQVVVAFRMLPEVVWAMPTLGTINLHASLLPQYRGAAPINWAIMNGETQTGLTTFFIEQEIDTGKIIFQEKMPIHPEDNAGTLHDRMCIAGADLVLKTVKAIAQREYPQIEQSFEPTLRPAPKIFKETCQIDWNKSSEEIHNQVRGLSPYPGAWTLLNGLHCKIYKTQIIDNQILSGESFAQQTTWLTDHKKYLCAKTQNGYIAIEELQIEGKKRINIREWLAGNKIF